MTDGKLKQTVRQREGHQHVAHLLVREAQVGFDQADRLTNADTIEIENKGQQTQHRQHLVANTRSRRGDVAHWGGSQVAKGGTRRGRRVVRRRKQRLLPTFKRNDKARASGIVGRVTACAHQVRRDCRPSPVVNRHGERHNGPIHLASAIDGLRLTMKDLFFVSCTMGNKEDTVLYRSLLKLGTNQYRFYEQNRTGLSTIYNQVLNERAVATRWSCSCMTT